MTKRVIKVVFSHFPSEATDEEIALFVEDALSTMGGCRDPNDPLFSSLEVLTVTIGNTTWKMKS